MAGLVKPRRFPIRKPQDNQQDTGLIYNNLRYPDHGGLTSASAFAKGGSPFGVEAPEKGSRSAEQANKRDEE